MNDASSHNDPSGSKAGTSGEAMLSLLHTAQVLQDRIELALEEVGLSSAKYGVLAQLAEAGEPLALGELAARLSCVRSNMTQLVDRLVADGLVQRTSDPADRRVVRTELTELGKDRAQAGARQWSAVQAEFAASLSESDHRMLITLLSTFH